MEQEKKPNKFVKFISNKWFLHAVGLIFIACLIWFVGPLIAIASNSILASVASRLFAILLVLAIWGSFQFYAMFKVRKNDAQFVENLTVQHAKRDEAQTIQDRFNDAIVTLKKTSDSGTKEETLLNTLPWYIIIGPPGSGKTTALLNSGLEFPLKDKLGADAIKGIGGTRHCDWWFTNEAVLIDTAGRFTTQDSDSEVDKTAWQSFMGMLKKYRKQRPINGALVTMSIQDMLTMSEEDHLYYAKTIRKRIEELNNSLSIKFPVYFMFTKCDLINGFNAYFDNLTAKQRNQVWGETFDIDVNGNCAININDYALHYEELIDRLNTQLLLNLKHQNDPAKKADIFSFPSQMEALKEPIHKFLVNIFGENKFQKSALLRGVYFTSGTQQGSPFDSLLGSMAENMGLDSEEDVNYSGKGRSYFIGDLLARVIFPESDLAGVDQKLQRMMKRLRIASLSMAFCLLAGLSTIWYLSYEENSERVQAVDFSIEQQSSLIESRLKTSTDFLTVLPELDAAKASINIFDPKTFTDNFGLNQKNSFDSQNRAIYLNTLETRLLPLVRTRLEEMMIDVVNRGNPMDLYRLLKAYLMYAGQHNIADVKFEAQWLHAISSADWQANFPEQPEVVAALSGHLAYLLSQSFAYVEPSEIVVSSARTALLNVPLEQQVYASIKDDMLADPKGDLTFSDITGNYGLDVFTSRDRQPLVDLYIPYMFTKKGFLSGFLLTASEKSDEYLANTWIFGEQNQQSTILSPDELQEKIYEIYYRDFISTWRQFVRNIKITPMENNQQGLAVLRIMSEPNSPLEKLFNTVAAQTNLTQASDISAQAEGVGQVASVVSSGAERLVSQANRISRVTEKANLVSLPGAPVTESFQPYHRLVSTERGDAKFNQVTASLSQFKGFIEQTLFDNFSDTPAFDSAVLRVTSPSRSEFSRLIVNDSANPDVLNGMLGELSVIGWKMVMQEALTDIQKVWQQQVYSVYNQSLTGRYPFDVRTNAEVEIRDFANFFKPKGIFDEFLKQYIKPFINANSAQWQMKSFGGVKLGLSGTTLADMQTAHQITQYFFKKNSNLPSLNITLLPISLDADAAQFSIFVGKQKVSYAHGPRRGTKINWPTNSGDETTRIEFIRLNGQIEQQSEMGPWSLFKFLDKQQVNPTSRNSVYLVNISVAELSAEYEVRADSEYNPLGAKILQGFTLPEEL